MKGVIFKHFEAFVCENFGEAVFEEILETAQLQTEGPFVGPETYPDADLFAMVGVATEKLGISVPDAVHAFGKDLYARLAKAVPMFVDDADDLKSFVKTIHSVIHVEVKKLFPGAETPHFHYEDTGPGRLVLHYTSSRKLCPLVRGLLEGAAESFGETLSLEETQCMHHGASSCVFELEFGVAARMAG